MERVDTQWKRKVVLHGSLAEAFPAENGSDTWELNVRSPAEAVRALEANRPGFYKHLEESGKDGIGYAVILTDKEGTQFSLNERELHHPLGVRQLDFVPMVVGSSDNPTINIIIGVVIIIAAIVLAPVTGGGSLLFAGKGGIALSAGGAWFLGGIGVSLALSGVSQLLSPAPDIGDFDLGEAASEHPSYSFSGAVNTMGQGRPVPMGYGELVIGSHVIAVGIKSFNVPV